MRNQDLEHEIAKGLLRKSDTHKGDYGRIFIIAGSRGMTGAAALTSLGALRGGAGLITLAVPESLNEIMERKLTEVMTLPLPETADGSFSLDAYDTLLEWSNKSDIVIIGPGLSRNSETASYRC